MHFARTGDYDVDEDVLTILKNLAEAGSGADAAL